MVHRGHASDHPDQTPDSGAMLRSLTILALLGHGVILVATALVGLTTLVIINVVSVVLYSAALALNGRRWYVFVLAIGMVEVTVHALVATALLGWASGFHIYLLALIPLVFFFDLWNLQARAATALLVAVLYVVLAWYAHTYLGRSQAAYVPYFRYGNFAIGAGVLAALSYYYGTAVRTAQHALESKNEELNRLARTDPLTGLANRREAVRLVELERARALRAGSGFAVAVIDADHFKRINDAHGHDCGDVVLVEIGKRLERSLRGQDSVARWGGEEFLVLLPETDPAGAVVAAEKMRRAIADEPFEFGTTSIVVSVTIGIDVFHSDTEMDAFLKRADDALYQGKAAGRNRVVAAWNA